MSGKLNVLVTGATGKQGGHLVRELLARGHSARALTRKPESPAAAALAARGVTIVSGDFDDQGSLERAARGVDTVFAMSTPFESGAKTETREGVNIVRAASAVGRAVHDRRAGILHGELSRRLDGSRHRKGVNRDGVAGDAPSATNRGCGYRAVHRPRHRTPREFPRSTNRHRV